MSGLPKRGGCGFASKKRRCLRRYPSVVNEIRVLIAIFEVLAGSRNNWLWATSSGRGEPPIEKAGRMRTSFSPGLVLKPSQIATAASTANRWRRAYSGAGRRPQESWKS